MAESQQKWLGRNRPPRVQITYDVETGGAIEKKEIPMVVGVMTDLSGTKTEPALPKVKERKFVEIDRDNFNEVLSSITPEAKSVVKNKLTGKGELSLTLKIRHMDDFRPERIVEQVEPLRKLLRARERLNDLLAKLEGNDNLDAALKKEAENLKKVKAATDKPADGGTDRPAEG
jgi:type VI secretion system protein ImpB